MRYLIAYYRGLFEKKPAPKPQRPAPDGPAYELSYLEFLVMCDILAGKQTTPVITESVNSQVAEPVTEQAIQALLTVLVTDSFVGEEEGVFKALDAGVDAVIRDRNRLQAILTAYKDAMINPTE